MKFLPDKYCEMAIKLKRKNRQFLANDFVSTANNVTLSIFQVNLIYPRNKIFYV